MIDNVTILGKEINQFVRCSIKTINKENSGYIKWQKIGGC